MFKFILMISSLVPLTCTLSRSFLSLRKVVLRWVSWGSWITSLISQILSKMICCMHFIYFLSNFPWKFNHIGVHPSSIHNQGNIVPFSLLKSMPFTFACYLCTECLIWLMYGIFHEFSLPKVSTGVCQFICLYWFYAILLPYLKCILGA